MEAGIKMLAVLSISPLLIFCVHMIAARMFRGSPPQLIAFCSVMTGSLPVAVALRKFALNTLLQGDALLSSAAYGAICYTAIGYSYFHFFNMSETARRIRILYEINRAGCLSEEDVAAIYKTTDIISVRLKRLVSLKQLKCEDGSYMVDGRTLYCAGYIILLWRRVLKLGDRDDQA